MSFPWENYLAVLDLLSLVCSSAFPRGTLSTCLSDTHILGSGHVLLYPLDTVPTGVGYISRTNGEKFAIYACVCELTIGKEPKFPPNG